MLWVHLWLHVLFQGESAVVHEDNTETCFTGDNGYYIYFIVFFTDFSKSYTCMDEDEESDTLLIEVKSDDEKRGTRKQSTIVGKCQSKAHCFAVWKVRKNSNASSKLVSRFNSNATEEWFRDFYVSLSHALRLSRRRVRMKTQPIPSFVAPSKSWINTKKWSCTVSVTKQSIVTRPDKHLLRNVSQHWMHHCKHSVSSIEIRFCCGTS